MDVLLYMIFVPERHFCGVSLVIWGHSAFLVSWYKNYVESLCRPSKMQSVLQKILACQTRQAVILDQSQCIGKNWEKSGIIGKVSWRSGIIGNNIREHEIADVTKKSQNLHHFIGNFHSLSLFLKRILLSCFLYYL
jgi:hypothetical protein